MTFSTPSLHKAYCDQLLHSFSLNKLFHTLCNDGEKIKSAGERERERIKISISLREIHVPLEATLKKKKQVLTSSPQHFECIKMCYVNLVFWLKYHWNDTKWERERKCDKNCIDRVFSEKSQLQHSFFFLLSCKVLWYIFNISTTSSKSHLSLVCCTQL